MTAPTLDSLTPDATRCPECTAPLDGTAVCPSCALPLQGPAAARLWEVDVALLRLEADRTSLLAERRGLLAQLRGVLRPPPTGAFAPATARLIALPAAPRPAPAPRPEWTPARTQNLLLSLGGLLLAVALVVFTAVTYDRLGAGGRAAILLALTAAAASAAPYAQRRGLQATAETVGAVTLVLAALDAYGLRKLGVADQASGLSFAAGSAAVLSALAAAYSRVAPLHVARCAAVLLAQLPVPLLLADQEASAATAGLFLIAQAAVDLAVLTLTKLPADARATLAAATVGSGALGLLISAAATIEQREAAGSLLAGAALLVAAGIVVKDKAGRTALLLVPVPVLALAAHTLSRAGLTHDQRPLVLVAVAFAAALAAAQLPRDWRTGPTLGGLFVTGAAVLQVASEVITGLGYPLSWLLDPWTLQTPASARAAASVGERWDGTVVTPVVLVSAALVATAAGVALHRLRAAAAPAAVLAAAAAVLLPLGLDLPYPGALALLLVFAAALATAGVLLVQRLGERALVLAAAGGAVALLAAVWSTADRTATLVVLPVAALLAAAVSSATRQTPAGNAAGYAGLLATAALAAVGAANDLAADQVGGLLLVAVAVLAGLSTLTRRTGLEVAAAMALGTAALLAITDAGWLSWVLAGGGLVALALALQPDRRLVAAAGGLLLSASSWVRLADAEVTAPEPYVLPLALVALALGGLRRHQQPDTRSFAAFGPGLSLLLLPSLLASFDDATATRALLLGGVALTVVLLGARFRLQAPLAIGGAVLAVDALQLLAPYAAALPRWSTLGLAGTLLVVVGATYEQRLRDVNRLRDRFDALA